MAAISLPHAVSSGNAVSTASDYLCTERVIFLPVVGDVVKVMEEFAPPSLSEEGDNIGLLVGSLRKEVNTVFVTLDADQNCINEAIGLNADLIIAHHPLIYRPVSSLRSDDYVTGAVMQLIKHDVCLYAAHTNLDWCDGGVNDSLCETLGLYNVSQLYTNPINGAKQGRIGYTDGCSLLSFVRNTQKALGTKLRYSGQDESTVRKIAVCGGSGAFLLTKAIDEKCDLYLTGELGYHDVQRAYFSGLPVIQAGHFYTENIVLKTVANFIKMRYNNISVVCSGRKDCYIRFS